MVYHKIMKFELVSMCMCVWEVDSVLPKLLQPHEQLVVTHVSPQASNRTFQVPNVFLVGSHAH